METVGEFGVNDGRNLFADNRFRQFSKITGEANWPKIPHIRLRSLFGNGTNLSRLPARWKVTRRDACVDNECKILRNKVFQVFDQKVAYFIRT